MKKSKFPWGLVVLGFALGTVVHDAAAYLGPIENDAFISKLFILVGVGTITSGLMKVILWLDRGNR